MGRKPDLARRREIAAAAFEIVKVRGVHRISMSDLAGELGMKRPTLYWYFRDLSEIFEAVLDLMMETQTAFTAERLAGIHHPIDILEGLVHADAEFFAGRRQDVIALFQLWGVAYRGETDKVLRKGLDFLEPFRAMLVDLVERGIREGQVAPCDPGALVDLVLAVNDGMQVQRVTRGADVHPIIRAFCESVLRPLRREPGEEERTRGDPPAETPRSRAGDEHRRNV